MIPNPMPNGEPAPASRLERLLLHGVFCVTAEVVPPRSAKPDGVTEQAVALERAADAVNVTDNPTSRVHMSPVAGAGLVAATGLEPTLQLTCRDRNRLALSSDLLGAWALGARNLLCLSGDPTAVGDEPDAKTVFDLTAMDLVRLAVGLRTDGRLLSGNRVKDAPAYFVGVVDAPLMPGYEYGRLEAKLDAGAGFVQTQIVFDADAFGVWADGARERGILERAAILVGVAVARSTRSARFMDEHLPGVSVPGAVFSRLEAAGPDAMEEGIRMAVETVARIKSIPGIAGVHMMGLGHLESLRRVVKGAGLMPRPTDGD